ncbi:hypothetical protein NC651_020138 [Populus alba x Populus x berolinensis]|nr:hypothetical protein NC651_020138 [Populus alba x Populus x berolinensis]
MLEMIITTTIFSASFLFFYAFITVCGNRRGVVEIEWCLFVEARTNKMLTACFARDEEVLSHFGQEVNFHMISSLCSVEAEAADDSVTSMAGEEWWRLSGLGMTYSGSSVGGHDGGSQHSLASRHSSILGGPQEADVGGFRDYASTTSHYEGGPIQSCLWLSFHSLLRCKSTQNKDNDLQSDMKAEKKDCSEDQPKNTSDTISPVATQGTGIKTTIKKKIIKKRSKLGVPNSSEMRDLKEDKKHEKESDQKSSSGTKTEVKADRQKVALKDNANSKGGKLKEDNKDKGG